MWLSKNENKNNNKTKHTDTQHVLYGILKYI